MSHVLHAKQEREAMKCRGAQCWVCWFRADLSWGSYPAMVLDVLIQGCQALSLVLGFRWDTWLDFFWAVQLFALSCLADNQRYF